MPRTGAIWGISVTIFGLAGVLEVFGGILLLLGLFTRPVAFVLAGEMAFAYFMGHAPQEFFPVNNGGDAAILYCFVFLYLFTAGPGAWTPDEASDTAAWGGGSPRVAGGYFSTTPPTPRVSIATPTGERWV